MSDQPEKNKNTQPDQPERAELHIKSTAAADRANTLDDENRVKVLSPGMDSAAAGALRAPRPAGRRRR